MNNEIESEAKIWQEEVRNIHMATNKDLPAKEIELNEHEILSDILRDSSEYEQNKPLSTLLQKIINLLGSVLDYLEFLYPYLREGNLLALLLLSVALVILLALLLMPPVWYIRCRMLSYKRQQRHYDAYRRRRQ